MSNTMLEFKGDTGYTALIDLDKSELFYFSRELGSTSWELCVYVGDEDWVCAHEGVDTVALIQQYLPHTTRPHYVWRLDTQIEYVQVVSIDHIRCVTYAEGGRLDVRLLSGKEFHIDNPENQQGLLDMLRDVSKADNWKDTLIHYLEAQEAITHD